MNGTENRYVAASKAYKKVIKHMCEQLLDNDGCAGYTLVHNGLVIIITRVSPKKEEKAE